MAQGEIKRYGTGAIANHLYNYHKKQAELAKQDCTECKNKKEDCGCLPWICEGCKHKWRASTFVTFEECPQCKSDYIGHGEVGKEL